MATDPHPPEPAVGRLERDLSEIEHLALVGPSEYGVEETLTRMRTLTREARERHNGFGGDAPDDEAGQ